MGRYYQFQRRVTRVYLSVILLAFCANAVSGEIIMTAPPREDSIKGEDLYTPLAEKLSELLGEKVIYQQPTGWFDYAHKMRNDQYDIIFDGPHFAAWRMKHLQHSPVAELPGDLEFIMVANKTDSALNELRDLAGKRVCGMLSPHLGTSLVLDAFPNPVIQPTIIEVEGGMKEVYASFKKGECRAAILRDAAYNRLPEEEKSALKIMLETRKVPNQTITVSKRLQKNAAAIANFITSKDGAMAADKILSRYSNKAKYFEIPDPQQYAGVENLLEGVVYGW